jgi:AcrR family transcriptional regulator
VSLVPRSTKEEIVRAAERLFAARGLDGVSLRQISLEAGTGNHSAVHYHFGSKDQLIRAIFEYRLPHLNERRRILFAQHEPTDLASVVECYVLPILEQGEQDGSHYLSFVAMLQQSADPAVFELRPAEQRGAIREYREQFDRLMSDMPAPLRAHRIAQAITFSVHASAVRERAKATGVVVPPFALHVADLLDGIVGFLEAPVSERARIALQASAAFDPAVALPL